MELKTITVPDDITYLAKDLELLVSGIEYPRFAFAMICLHILCASFMRGKGLKLGNSQSLQKNLETAASLTTAVVQRVANDEARETWFPTLCRLGFSNLESVTAKLKAHDNGAATFLSGP